METQQAIEKLTRLDLIARTGMASRGIVYVLFGGLLLLAGAQAVQVSSETFAAEGQRGAFAALYELPYGSILLGLLALGLFAYTAYRAAAAVFDVEYNGTRPVGIIDRIGHLGVAATYFILACSAAQIAIGLRHVDAGYGNASSRWLAQYLLEMPLGPILLGLVGIGFCVSTVLNARNAIRGTHMRLFSATAPAYVKHTGRAGMFAQAAVAALIGWSLIRAAWFESARQAHALGGALRHIREHTLIYDSIAAGLLMFGLFSLMMARYRIVPKVKIDDLARDKAAEIRFDPAA